MKIKLNKLSIWIENRYSIFLMLFMLMVTVFFFWIFNESSLPFSNPEMIKISGDNGLLDLLPFYSGKEAYDVINSYGDEGRKLYLRFISADYIFIIFYSLGFAFLLTLIVRSAKFNNANIILLNTLPFSIGILDFIENSLILSMLLTFPVKMRLIGTMAGIATMFKHIMSIFSIIILVLCSIVLFYRQLTNRKSNN